MRKSHILLTGATTYAVSVDELKAHLRIATTADDTLLALYSQAAELQAESIMVGRSVTPKKWGLILDEFPADDADIELMKAPVSSSATDVVIKYIASSGTTNTFAAASYAVDTEVEPGRIRLISDSSGDYDEWPDTLDHPRAVQISYMSGCAAASVPEPIKQWIKMRVGQMYEFREPIVAGEALQTLRRDFIDGLLDKYIVYPSDYL